MEKGTSEFSFILKPSRLGIGVFAAHDIKSSTYLRLFRGKDEPKTSRIRAKKEVPEIFREFCVDRGDEMLCPEDFGRMNVGWYLNHSKNPNAQHRDYEYYSLRDIKAGEEITIDYNSLEEPKEGKADFYSE